MKQDKALRKTLSQCEAQLPDGFHPRMMDAIHQEAERISRRSYVRGVAMAAAVSFLLMAAAVYLLAVYTQFNLAGIIPRLDMGLLTKPSAVYSAYFASIIIVLLTLDLLFRQAMGRSQR